MDYERRCCLFRAFHGSLGFAGWYRSVPKQMAPPMCASTILRSTINGCTTRWHELNDSNKYLMQCMNLWCDVRCEQSRDSTTLSSVAAILSESADRTETFPASHEVAKVKKAINLRIKIVFRWAWLVCASAFVPDICRFIQWRWWRERAQTDLAQK